MDRNGNRKRGSGAATKVVRQRTTPENLRAAIWEQTQELVKELIQDEGLMVGRSLRSGQLHALGLLDNEIPPNFQIHEATRPGSNATFDVFGNDISKGLPPSCQYVTCDNCGKKCASSRFADHLAKCILGQGRASSRPRVKPTSAGNAEESASSSSLKSSSPSVVNVKGSGGGPHRSVDSAQSTSRRGTTKPSTPDMLSASLKEFGLKSPSASMSNGETGGRATSKKVKVEEASMSPVSSASTECCEDVVDASSASCGGVKGSRKRSSKGFKKKDQ